MESGKRALPASLVDPISLEVFVDPVVASDGHTYERSSISRWFKRCKHKNQPLTSPITREPMDDMLHCNLVVRKLVTEVTQQEKATVDPGCVHPKADNVRLPAMTCFVLAVSLNLVPVRCVLPRFDRRARRGGVERRLDPAARLY